MLLHSLLCGYVWDCSAYIFVSFILFSVYRNSNDKRPHIYYIQNGLDVLGFVGV